MTQKTVRVGVAGAGMWGSMHLKAYSQHPSAQVVGICDLDKERAKTSAEEFKAPEYVTNIEELLDLGIDCLSVATPDNAHTDIAIRAAEKGIHILVEKPLATTVKECSQIIDAAEKNNVILMVDWHNRWNPPFFKAYRSIRDNELGKITYIYSRLSDTLFVPTEMLPWAGKSSVLWFLGSHSIDTVCWLINEKPVSVSCKRKEGILKGMGIDTADMYITIIDFENGASAVVENSWVLPNTSPSLIDHKCDIIGTEGMISLDLSHNRAYVKYTDETKKGMPAAEYPDIFVVPQIHGRQSGFAVESIYHFVECVRDGKKPAAGGEDGLLNTKLILAAEESASKGKSVSIK